MNPKFRDYLECMREGDKIEVQARCYPAALSPPFKSLKKTYGRLTPKIPNYYPYTCSAAVQAYEKGYLELVGTRTDSYYTHYTLARTAKKIKRIKRSSSNKLLYKYNFQDSQYEHYKRLCKAPWRIEDKAMRAFKIPTKWNFLPSFSALNMREIRRTLYHHFIEELKDFSKWEVKYPLLLRIANGELFLTLAMVKVEEVQGVKFFKNLTDEEAVEKMESLITPLPSPYP